MTMVLHNHLWKITTTISLATALYGLVRKNELYVLDLLQLSLALTNDLLTQHNYNVASIQYGNAVMKNINHIIFHIYGYFYVPQNYHMIGYTNIICSGSLGILSKIYYRLKYDKWIYFYSWLQIALCLNKMVIYSY